MPLVELDSLVTSCGTQHRAALDLPTAEKYGTLMSEGSDLGPLEVFRLAAAEAGLPAGALVLAGGFHRVKGALDRGITHLEANVYDGTLDDARVFAFEENAKHGLPQSRDDLQRKLLWALQHPLLKDLSNRELARRSGATHPTVQAAREKLAKALAKAAEGGPVKPPTPLQPEEVAALAKVGTEPEGFDPLPPWATEPTLAEIEAGVAPKRFDLAKLPELRKGDTLDQLCSYAMHCSTPSQPLPPFVFPVFGGEVHVTAVYISSKFDA